MRRFMRHRLESGHKKTARSTAALSILVALSCSLFLLLAMRMADLQLLQGAAFRAQANANRLFTHSIPAERGVFTDVFGDPLVFNVRRYYSLEDSGQVYSPRTRITRVDALVRMASDAASVTYEIERQYRFPESTAHVLGYTGQVSAKDLAEDRSLGFTDSIGKMGLEALFNDTLRGQSGRRQYEINALGKLQRLVSTEPGKPGQSVETTIDPYLSQVAYDALGENQGAVVILDGDTGGVLSLVSKPSFNATVMSSTQVEEAAERSRRQQVADYISHPQKLFFNRAISGAYPPGSVFKIVTALAGLESEAITATTTVRDEGVLEVGEYSYANWYYTQYGRVEGDIALQHALARSNDIYFYKAAEWMGPVKLAELARMFGFGAKTGIELTPEVAGTVPDPAWKERVIGERWFLGNTYHFGIGQGNLLVTPLQVAQMTQAMAKHGTLCSPHLVNNQESKSVAAMTLDCAELGISQEHLELVMWGMLDACSPGGTGFPFFEHNREVRSADQSSPYREIDAGAVACKTGTAEFGAVDAEGYKSTHAWFTSLFTTPDLIDEHAEGDGLDDQEPVPVPEGDEAQLLELVGSSEYGSVDRSEWLEKVQARGSYPKKLVIMVLVESNEASPYKEGSSDGGPVAKRIFDFVYGNEPIQVEPPPEVLAE